MKKKNTLPSLVQGIRRGEDQRGEVREDRFIFSLFSSFPESATPRHGPDECLNPCCVYEWKEDTVEAVQRAGREEK